MGQKPRVYFENLDGLRFFCFLAIFFFHSFHTDYLYISNSSVYGFVKRFLVANGNLGVNFFFVLSGFLITYLLLEEKNVYGKINLLDFWKRRVLRIWPLFFACLFFGFIIFPQIKILFGEMPRETANPFYYISFLNNFDFIKKPPDASVLGVLWSVAIEEQFYFIWPLLLSVVPAKWYVHFFVGIITISLAFRAIYDNPVYNEYHTLSCIGDMTIGGLGALWIQNGMGRQSIERWNRVFLIILYGIVLIVFLFRRELLYSFYAVRVLERAFVAVLFLLVILEQNYARNSLFKVGDFKTVSRLGVYTYGLYCLHFIGILAATHLTSLLHLNIEVWQVLLLDTILALLFTIFIAKLSYQYFERPFLKLKSSLAHISTR
jgi:peptidoglycan/LPS O-acetylase OafA/YrhL